MHALITRISMRFKYVLYLYLHNRVKYTLKDTLKAFEDFKNKQESVGSNVFWDVKMRIFWKCIQYTIDWYKTQMLKKFPLGETNDTKISSLFSFASSNWSRFYFGFAIFM